MRVYMDIIADKFWVVYRSLSQNFDLNLAVIFFGAFKFLVLRVKRKMLYRQKPI